MLIMVLCTLISCAPEMRIARRYIRSGHETPVLFFHTDSLMKISSKLPVADTVFDTSGRYLDSLAFSQTKYVQHINNKEFLRQYVAGFTAELDKFGFRVYNDTAAYKFFSDTTKGYIINLAQVELEEFSKQFTSGFMIDENGEPYQFDIDAVALNSWFEIRCSNCDSGLMQVMFAAHSRAGTVKTRMKQNEFTGDLYLGYDVADMNMIDVYGLADMSALQNASYLFDLVMNEYILHQMGDPAAKPAYLHYDVKKKKIKRAGEKKFIRMK